ncbi:hypothetical protein CQW23_02706 [Capsicum baccatum]|uniref:Transcription repressor n=1 Tax=Capsicum baccatum TaxID=33114 RepID=A0A2G2XS80_CAPBA|nr:hypothetical protein CQW23_02706 [Capsicum baccatum]
MKLSSLFKNSSQTSSPWPWPLPTCTKPKTLSFRLNKDDDDNNNNNIFNSTFHLDNDNDTTSYSLDEFFSEVDETSFSTTTTINGQDCIEKMIKGLRLEKERLFFDFQESNNIINTSTSVDNIDISFVPIFDKESAIVMGLDSKDPFVDFRESMEEMVEAHGVQDWESLEELLTCYLKVNCKSNHGYIVGAFVDLLVNLGTNNNDDGVGGLSCVDSSVLMSHPFQFLQKYTSFGESNTHPSTLGASDSTMMKSVNEEQCVSSSSTTTSHNSFTSPLSFCSSSTSSSSVCLSLLEEEDEVIQRKKQC